jgi:hypothetical protein
VTLVYDAYDAMTGVAGTFLYARAREEKFRTHASLRHSRHGAPRRDFLGFLVSRWRGRPEHLQASMGPPSLVIASHSDHELSGVELGDTAMSMSSMSSRPAAVATDRPPVALDHWSSHPLGVRRRLARLLIREVAARLRRCAPVVPRARGRCADLRLSYQQHRSLREHEMFSGRGAQEGAPARPLCLPNLPHFRVAVLIRGMGIKSEYNGGRA